MVGPELLLDSNIHLWVVLPIVIITFFVGMIRHYVSILLQSDKKLTQEQVSDRSAPYPLQQSHSLVTLGKKVQGLCQFARLHQAPTSSVSLAELPLGSLVHLRSGDDNWTCLMEQEWGLNFR